MFIKYLTNKFIKQEINLKFNFLLFISSPVKWLFVYFTRYITVAHIYRYYIYYA